MAPDTFGGLVKQRRMALEMSQAGLADLVGRSASAVRSWERGSSTPTDESVVRSLAAVLGIDEGALRVTVGMPADIDVDDVEHVGGYGLAAFVDSDSEASPATDQKLDGHDDEVPLGADITWDDVAASVRPAPEPASPLERSKVDLPTADEGEDGELGPEPKEDTPAAVAREGDLAIADTGPAAAEDGEGPDGSQPDVEPVPVVSTGVSKAAERLIPATPATPASPVAQAASPAPTTASASARTAMMPARIPSPAPIAKSYLDDPDQMMTYWIRTALTVALTMFLLVVLFWALGRLGDSIGEVWDLFKAGT